MKKYEKPFARVGCHLLNILGGMPPRKQLMKQVVVYLEPKAHESLKIHAKVNRRTMGQQLLAMAFGVGFAPANTAKRTTKKGARV